MMELSGPPLPTQSSAMASAIEYLGLFCAPATAMWLRLALLACVLMLVFIDEPLTSASEVDMLFELGACNNLSPSRSQRHPYLACQPQGGGELLCAGSNVCNPQLKASGAAAAIDSSCGVQFKRRRVTGSDLTWQWDASGDGNRMGAHVGF